MASKKPSTATTKTAGDIVSHTKAIAALTKALEDTDKRSAELKQFQEEALLEWTTQLDATKRAHEVETDHMDQSFKRRKVEHELDIKSHGFETASELLEKEGFAVLKKVELEELKIKLQSAVEKVGTIEGDTEDRVIKDLARDHEMAVTRIQLENEAKVAQLKEQNKMLTEQIGIQKQTMVDLRGDVEKTREMVTSIAASAKPQVIREVKGER